VSRESLRDYLRARRLGWVEDPSNADPRFLRVQARQVLEALAPLGLDAPAILATTRRLSAAREALDVAAEQAARRIAAVEAGDVTFDRDGFLALPAELRRRLLSHALGWVASSDYRPRHEALAEALRAIAEGRDATLHGCRLVLKQGRVRIARELQAVKALRAGPAMLWDRRWRMLPPEGADLTGLEVAALGEAGLKACPKWRETGLPRVSLLAAPAVWNGADLAAAPLAGRPAGWRAELARGDEDYFATILSH
jgi:tRNA(Ile)-lysidine synthase